MKTSNPLLLWIALLFLVPGLGACSRDEQPLLVATPDALRPPTPEPEQQLLDQARAIHQRVITIDTHVDINTANFTADRNYAMDLAGPQVTLPKMQAGGLDVAWLVVYTPQGELTDAGFAAAYANAMDKFSAIHRLVDEIAPEQIGLALTAGEVRLIHGHGRKVAMIGVENAYPIGTDLSQIAVFHGLGARYMSLAHNGHNQFADSHTGEQDDAWLHDGLSELGREAVREMNRLGIMVDISHPSRNANLQAMALSRAPVIASHSASRFMNDVSRNLSDKELRALQLNGGVVQTTAFPSFIDSWKHWNHYMAQRSLLQEFASERGITLLEPDEFSALDDEARGLYRDQIARLNKLARPRLEAEIHPLVPPVDVADFVDHIDYMVELIGIDHVGISSDFDGGGGVHGWNDASQTLNITVELLRRGYTEEDIARLWGENLLRVLEEVQQVAMQIQAQETGLEAGTATPDSAIPAS